VREASFALPGDPELARARCAEAEQLGRDLADVDLEMTALALGGLIRVSQGEVAEGMSRLDEATAAATAGEMRDRSRSGSPCSSSQRRSRASPTPASKTGSSTSSTASRSSSPSS
jgi:hypothetical protein